MSRSIFAGFQPNSDRSNAHVRDLQAARLRNPNAELIHKEIDWLFNRSGLHEACASLTDLCIELIPSDRFCVDEIQSRYMGRKVYYVTVRVDVRGFRHGIDQTARYWQQKIVGVEALLFVANKFKAGDQVKRALMDYAASLPSGSPWPPIPVEAPVLESAFEDGAANAVLPQAPGVLWITLKKSEKIDLDGVIGKIQEFVLTENLGGWDGDSTGEEESDVSFEVNNLRLAGERVSDFIKSNWSALTFDLLGEEGEGSAENCP